MQHIRFNAMHCPIARSLDCVGEWWNILILRDAFHGATRFNQFQKSLGIAPNILSRRLRGLVQAGLMQKIPCNDRPLRGQYVLTAVGRDFWPVLWALLNWGNKHFMSSSQRLLLAAVDGARPVLDYPGPPVPQAVAPYVINSNQKARRQS